jgi:hypothetical protein
MNRVDPTMTIARRLAEMVGELYTRGHQLLDFHPHIAGAGFVRYILSVDEHPRMPSADADPRYVSAVWDSLADASLPWTDDASDTPDALADAFLARYPYLAGLSRGERPVRAAWYADMLRATAPTGVLVHWHDEYETAFQRGLATVYGLPGVEHWPLPPDYRHPLRFD